MHIFMMLFLLLKPFSDRELRGRSGTCREKRKENQRGLGILPYENFIIRTIGKYGEFRPCVRTWAVLAILAILDILYVIGFKKFLKTY